MGHGRGAGRPGKVGGEVSDNWIDDIAELSACFSRARLVQFLRDHMSMVVWAATDPEGRCVVRYIDFFEKIVESGLGAGSILELERILALCAVAGGRMDNGPRGQIRRAWSIDREAAVRGVEAWLGSGPRVARGRLVAR